MLQSVLYFTGIFTQQYWLTPFLSFLLEKKNPSDQAIQNELERIDNIMIPGDKKKMSWNIINNRAALPTFEQIKTILLHPSGVSYNHYWFYKMEYMLWKNWDRNDAKFKRYRVVSKNSVEHVFPQKQEYQQKLNDSEDNQDWLNLFGNLALLSVGQNSSYSNQDVEKKKIDFERKDAYDSLKLAKIYLFDKWDSEQIKRHQEEMFQVFANHYNQNS